MRMRLPELQENNKETKNLRLEKKWLLESWKEIEPVLYYQRLLYILKVMCSELMSRHYDNPLVGHFEIDKT